MLWCPPVEVGRHERNTPAVENLMRFHSEGSLDQTTDSGPREVVVPRSETSELSHVPGSYWT